MRLSETILGYIPIVLMAGGAIVNFVPATWVELPIATRTLGTALFVLGGVLLYAGWYDRFDIDSDTTVDDPTSQAPVQTTGYLAPIRKYGFAVLTSIGAVLSWGQLRNPDRFTLVDRPPLELPWGDQPVLGFAFIVAGLALFVLTHIAIPFFTSE